MSHKFISHALFSKTTEGWGFTEINGGEIKKGKDTRYRKQGIQQRHSKINPRMPTVKQTREQHPD